MHGERGQRRVGDLSFTFGDRAVEIGERRLKARVALSRFGWRIKPARLGIRQQIANEPLHSRGAIVQVFQKLHSLTIQAVGIALR